MSISTKKGRRRFDPNYGSFNKTYCYWLLKFYKRVRLLERKDPGNRNAENSFLCKVEKIIGMKYFQPNYTLESPCLCGHRKISKICIKNKIKIRQCTWDLLPTGSNPTQVDVFSLNYLLEP